MRSVARFGLSILLLTGCGVEAPVDPDSTSSPGPATAPPLHTGAKIAFVAFGQVWAMNPDGSDQHPIWAGPGICEHPAWSHHGRRIVVDCRSGDVARLHVVRADGTDPVQVTDASVTFSERFPDWSPDGQRILFTGHVIDPAVDPFGTGLEIFVMDADGSDVVRLTDNVSLDAVPRWSPSGREIAFISDRSGQQEIWKMNADGSAPTRVTDVGFAHFPDWSPDGRRIAFVANFHGPDMDVGIIDADGTDLVRVTNDPHLDWTLSWSQDGSKISFGSRRDNPWSDVYVMGVDGSDITRLSQFQGSSPDWGHGLP